MIYLPPKAALSLAVIFALFFAFLIFYGFRPEPNLLLAAGACASIGALIAYAAFKRAMRRKLARAGKRAAGADSDF